MSLWWSLSSTLPQTKVVYEWPLIYFKSFSSHEKAKFGIIYQLSYFLWKESEDLTKMRISASSCKPSCALSSLNIYRKEHLSFVFRYNFLILKKVIWTAFSVLSWFFSWSFTTSKTPRNLYLGGNFRCSVSERFHNRPFSFFECNI